jgi:hypothetical protein
MIEAWLNVIVKTIIFTLIGYAFFCMLRGGKKDEESDSGQILIIAVISFIIFYTAHFN